jgi:hypothetical protein
VSDISIPLEAETHVESEDGPAEIVEAELQRALKAKEINQATYRELRSLIFRARDRIDFAVSA